MTDQTDEKNYWQKHPFTGENLIYVFQQFILYCNKNTRHFTGFDGT
jgi:hypothetical protein